MRHDAHSARDYMVWTSEVLSEILDSWWLSISSTENLRWLKLIWVWLSHVMRDISGEEIAGFGSSIILDCCDCEVRAQHLGWWVTNRVDWFWECPQSSGVKNMYATMTWLIRLNCAFFKARYEDLVPSGLFLDSGHPIVFQFSKSVWLQATLLTPLSLLENVENPYTFPLIWILYKIFVTQVKQARTRSNGWIIERTLKVLRPNGLSAMPLVYC
jgi:hypothetical protein